MIEIDGSGQVFTVKGVEHSALPLKDGTYHINYLPCFVHACSRNLIPIVPSRRFVESVYSLFEETHEYNPGLYPYQVQGADFLARNRVALLFDEMGLGKTVQALSALPKKAAAIIVAPAYLKGVWYREACKWTPNFEIRVCKNKQDFLYPKSGQILICNYEQLPNEPAQFGSIPFYTYIIADEAHYIKNYKSKRTKNFRKIVRGAIKNYGSAWLLTGTPILNRPNELWAILQSVGIGTRLYKNYDRYARMFGGWKDGLGVTRWIKQPKPDAIDPIRPYVLRRKREEVLPDLPQKTYQKIVVPLEQALLRKKLDLIAEREEDVTEDIICGGKHVHEIAKLRRQLALHKMSTVFRLVEAYEENELPVVVFSCHREPVEDLGRRAGWASILGGMDSKQRDNIVEEFQAGKLRGLACTIKSAGAGLTLTRAAHAIFVDLDWSPSSNLQAEDRLLRIGQQHPVLIQQILFDHPLDYHVANVIEKKQKTIDSSVNKLGSSEQILFDELRPILAMLNDIHCAV